MTDRQPPAPLSKAIDRLGNHAPSGRSIADGLRIDSNLGKVLNALFPNNPQRVEAWRKALLNIGESVSASCSVRLQIQFKPMPPASSKPCSGCGKPNDRWNPNDEHPQRYCSECNRESKRKADAKRREEEAAKDQELEALKRELEQVRAS